MKTLQNSKSDKNCRGSSLRDNQSSNCHSSVPGRRPVLDLARRNINHRSSKLQNVISIILQLLPRSHRIILSSQRTLLFNISSIFNIYLAATTIRCLFRFRNPNTSNEIHQSQHYKLHKYVKAASFQTTTWCQQRKHYPHNRFKSILLYSVIVIYCERYFAT